ncbi:DNA-3-methyladenine glycosylase 2 family protein [Vibrio sp. 2-Bac 85]
MMNKENMMLGMEALSLIDEDIKQAYTEIGLPAERSSPEGFETFLSTIISQQLSTKVAMVIKDRVVALMEDLTPESLLNIPDQSLRDAGLSWRKVEYAKGLAEAIATNRFDIDNLGKLSDDDAIKAITEIKGFGRWSAEIYLMFSLDRKDVFPADDLGLLVALKHLKGVPEKPTAKQAREIVKHWSPWQSAGALFLWQYYHQLNLPKKA